MHRITTNMIYAFLNQKGGVGKTTLSIHTAAELSSRGRRVLLIDADPQGSSLGCPSAGKSQHPLDVVDHRIDRGGVLRPIKNAIGMQLKRLMDCVSWRQSDPQVVMTNPYQLLIERDGPAEISTTDLAILVAGTNAFDIDRYSLELSDDQRKVALWRVADHVRRGGTIEALTTGAMLALFDQLTTDQTRTEYYAHMSEETGISRTQLFRSLAMFRCFGRELLSDLNAASRCTCEALKILASPSVSDAARDAARDHVRNGNVLTIKNAKNFQREFASPSDQRTPTVATNRSVIWQHVDSDVRVLVKGLRVDGEINDESIVLALESALVAYRRVAVDNHTHPQTI